MHATGRLRVLLVVENCPFVRDPRVKREAQTLNSAGYQVSVVSPSASRAWYSRQTVNEVVLYTFRSMAGLGYFGEYVCATIAIAMLCFVVCCREGFDVVHVANPPDSLVLTVALFKMFGKRIIYDQHDLSPELFQTKFARTASMIPILIWLERWSYRLANHVIVTNESYKKVAQDRGAIPGSKVTIVRNGPDLTRGENCESDIELRRMASNSILYAGNVSLQDGLDILCRILATLRHDLGREDFCCIVVGDGDALPAVKELARKCRIDDKVWFTGWIDDSNKYLRYLNSGDICVAPDPPTSYNNQSTFIKILDYMGAGKPIVAFDLVETRFSAQDAALYSNNGSEREFAARLVELMDNSELRNELGQRGKNRILKELAWQYSAVQLLNAYRTCSQ